MWVRFLIRKPFHTAWFAWSLSRLTGVTSSTGSAGFWTSQLLPDEFAEVMSPPQWCLLKVFVDLLQTTTLFGIVPRCVCVCGCVCLCLLLSLCLSVSISVSVSLSLSVYVCLAGCLSSGWLAGWLAVCLLAGWLAVCLFCLSLSLSVSLSVCLSCLVLVYLANLLSDVSTQ